MQATFPSIETALEDLQIYEAKHETTSISLQKLLKEIGMLKEQKENLKTRMERMNQIMSYYEKILYKKKIKSDALNVNQNKCKLTEVKIVEKIKQIESEFEKHMNNYEAYGTNQPIPSKIKITQNTLMAKKDELDVIVKNNNMVIEQLMQTLYK